MLAAGSAEAFAVKIGDVARFQGEFPNKVMGMGLVVGLPGTGDGGEFMPAMRPLSRLLGRLANPVGVAEELKNAKNVAIVLVEATLPENGVREGDRIDVQVSSVGAAKGLSQGRLVMTPLLSGSLLSARGDAPWSGPDVLAFASGPLVVTDPKSPRTAIVRQGAVIEANIIHNYVALGRDLDHYKKARQAGSAIGRGLLEWIRPDEPYVTLVIDDAHASWAMANIMAQMINDDSADPDAQGQARGASTSDNAAAMAVDRNNVLVRVPETARRNPAPFLARIETLDLLMPPSEARVIVNREAGSVIITGDVQISPVVITFKGMTITTTTPEPKPTPDNPRVDEKQFAPLDPSHRGGTKLQELVDALNTLKIPPADRVRIIEELSRMGKLHAKLIVEE
jgi:flagellar P-ring protein precursor FlgI